MSERLPFDTPEGYAWRHLGEVMKITPETAPAKATDILETVETMDEPLEIITNSLAERIPLKADTDAFVESSDENGETITSIHLPADAEHQWVILSYQDTWPNWWEITHLDAEDDMHRVTSVQRDIGYPPFVNGELRVLQHAGSNNDQTDIEHIITEGERAAQQPLIHRDTIAMTERMMPSFPDDYRSSFSHIQDLLFSLGSAAQPYLQNR